MRKGSAILREKETGEALREEKDPVSSPSQAKGGCLDNNNEWRKVHGQGSKGIPPLPTAPCPVPLKNRYEALVEEGQLSENVDDDQPTSQIRQSKKRTPWITTTPTRRKRRVIVVGDSFLRGMEGLVCRVDPPQREVCCLPGARVKDITRKLPGLVHLTDYYP
ncbi:suppression of tumorigenicity 5 [Limosa lapponica baueri]|uniref:Suppression of tumorigenicity 5 n=1 Tax=Limosa lapponica baueri TaxID=1758121 RepID=A0A2I0ULL6_LIMLA|nr:suppression of tumorigenicity 5 [Limosa lapponica baueri]